ncbi:MAG: hypothetical protein AAFQ36_02920 [Pseudomonadota bacterium]
MQPIIRPITIEEPQKTEQQKEREQFAEMQKVLQRRKRRWWSALLDR